MTSNLMQACPVCQGEGTVPRVRRSLPNGEPDKFDTVIWPSVICSACGGSGKIADRSSPAGEPAPNQ